MRAIEQVEYRPGDLVSVDDQREADALQGVKQGIVEAVKPGRDCPLIALKNVGGFWRSHRFSMIRKAPQEHVPLKHPVDYSKVI